MIYNQISNSKKWEIISNGGRGNDGQNGSNGDNYQESILKPSKDKFKQIFLPLTEYKWLYDDNNGIESVHKQLKENLEIFFGTQIESTPSWGKDYYFNTFDISNGVNTITVLRVENHSLILWTGQYFLKFVN